MGLFKTITKRLITALMVMLGTTGMALANKPEPWQVTFQEAASENMTMITDLNNFLLVLMTVITAFVLALLLYVMVRFNAKANPTPSKTSHNTLIEVLWTVLPIVILVVIAIPSFRLLYFQREIPEADMTIKATGYQWYWGYEYPDHGGLKIDSVPGRMNETWFKAEKTGTFYGQCSELCGIRHAFMPIRIEVVEKEAFAAWVEEAQEEYAEVETSKSQLAGVQDLTSTRR